MTRLHSSYINVCIWVGSIPSAISPSLSHSLSVSHSFTLSLHVSLCMCLSPSFTLFFTVNVCPDGVCIMLSDGLLSDHPHPSPCFTPLQSCASKYLFFSWQKYRHTNIWVHLLYIYMHICILNHPSYYFYVQWKLLSVFSCLVDLCWRSQLWKSVLFWQKNSCQIQPVCQLQHTWLCGVGYLSDESARKRECNLLSKASDYSILRVREEGKFRHIPRGQASQIPQEENVEMTAEIWEFRNPPCSSNGCLETKQHSSFFFLPLFFLATKPTIFIMIYC